MLTLPPLAAMPHFAVFFSDRGGFGIEIVQATEAGHAQDIARAQHPCGRLSPVPAELLDGQASTNCWGRGSESRVELFAYNDEEVADAHMDVEVVAAALAPIDKCAD